MEEMSHYGVGNTHKTGINNVANGMTLRADIHLCLGLHEFVIYPAGPRFRMHMLVNDADYTELLHWRPVVIPDRVSIEYLYAHFAYTIIHSFPSISAGLFKHVACSIEAEKAKAERLAMAEKISGKRKLTSLEATTDGVRVC
jgi:hypothetical protein